MCTYLGARICCGRSTSCFTYGFVIQVIIEKTLRSKDFIKNLTVFFSTNNRNFNSHILSYKFAFIHYIHFINLLRNQK